MVAAAKLIGGGLATIGVGGGAIGAGLIFSALINGTSRNPSLKGELFSLAILAFSLSEAVALFCLMVAFLILFAF
ncbi:ATP synthase F0 subunit c (mitochondrion) [Paramicrosporidium saccamoebae]|uniref:ATP synthase subunit 9, mitochondrial n=1 Tax=Paramicrosporidium saccamoebae TaxID=1246581 RepID=A0A2H9TR27_9FUNG|nr:ATP synthase F0 subunit c [Paramicrosporidium saccamoebae]